MKGLSVPIICVGMCLFLASGCEKSTVRKTEVAATKADCSRFELMAEKLKVRTDRSNKKLLVLISDGRFNVPGADEIDQNIVFSLLSKDSFDVVLQINSMQELAETLPCNRQLEQIKDTMREANMLNYGRKSN